MKKYIVRQCAPDCIDLSRYFEGDSYNENAGHFCYTLFLLNNEYGRVYGYNSDVWNEYKSRANDVLNDMEYTGTLDYDGRKITLKSVMENWDIPYNPRRAHMLKEWAESADPDDFDSMAEFLSIVTGKTWETMGVRGYCQGDYVTVVFCPDFNSRETAKICGEVWLGCANEYSVSTLDENGEESDTVYGYIVADCQVCDDEDIKRLVCEWACIPVEETELQMIDGEHTYTEYTYRTA